MLSEPNDRGKILCHLARVAISHALDCPCSSTIEIDKNATWLNQPGATFVTLTQHGKLRGCIGSLQAYDPLIENVCSNAVTAALRDTRFTPLTITELDTINVEVSLLSEVQLLGFIDETDALIQLQPGIDGIVFEYGGHRSTFLPQVWESLPLPQQFLAHLKVKAGLSENFWVDDIKLSRYTVSKWSEADFSKESING